MGMNVSGGRSGMTSDINVTPFCDVCLVLLIIFMVVTPLLQKGVPVLLPSARNPEPEPEKESNITISVQADGKVYYGDKWVPSDALRENLTEAYSRNPGRAVYIKGDKRVAFGDIKQVLRTIQDVGFKTVGMVSQHVDAQGNVVTGNAASAVGGQG
jgi:biopolymer transport protein TolR